METTLSVELIHRRLEQVYERVDRAALSAGRDASEVRLVVVTKKHPVDVIEMACQAGATRLGENYADEAVEKIRALAGIKGVEWHMIGHVQSRKANLICPHFAWLHSLDSLKLAKRLDRFAGEHSLTLPVLMECNVSGEESKFGWAAWQDEMWPDLVTAYDEIVSLPNLEVRGLMTMAPYLPDPEDARPFFRKLRGLQSFLTLRLPQVSWGELSMGMSADFDVAVQEGATWIRVGQAILG